MKQEDADKFNAGMAVACAGGHPSKINIAGEKAVLYLGDTLDEQLKIPYGVTEICRESGYTRDLNSLREVMVPDSVVTIGRMAFSGAENLTNIIGATRVETIGDRAFWDCEKIIEIDMPNVTEIMDEAFRTCKDLSKVAFNNVNKVGKNVFAGTRLTEFIGCPSLIGPSSFNTNRVVGIIKQLDLHNIKTWNKWMWHAADCAKEINLEGLDYIDLERFVGCVKKIILRDIKKITVVDESEDDALESYSNYRKYNFDILFTKDADLEIDIVKTNNNGKTVSRRAARAFSVRANTLYSKLTLGRELGLMREKRG